MISRPTRIVAVGTVPVNIRKTAVGANDPLAAPTAKSLINYAAGGGTIELVPLPTSVFGDGTGVPVTADYLDDNSANMRYAVASAGSINVRVTDMVA